MKSSIPKPIYIYFLLLAINTPSIFGQSEYDYAEVIALSSQFYKAQRTGKLPDNDIPWRVDTFLEDGADVGMDLTGGYFDAGDFVKFGFPHAGFTTIINWGLIDHLEGYESVQGLKEGAYETVRWSLDYLIKCHPEPNVLWGQVGDGELDHSNWGRPEDWPHGPRSSYKITEEAPGSELAVETAAAFASGYLVFKDVDPSYAATLLRHAIELYDFGNNFRGKYNDAIPATGFYDSWSGYGDDLGWGAAWMYRATNDQKYLDDLESHWNEFGYQGSNAGQFSWDDKYAGVFVLGAKITGEQKYFAKAEEFCNKTLYLQPRTPKGLAFLGTWGPLRYASNAAFVCLGLADLGVNTNEYRAFAKQQIHYILGDGGRSYIVGYGVNPPTHPHHRASSCPDKPAQCDWNTYNGPQPNAHVIAGALVGGPDDQDNYVDSRLEWEHTEVGCDYNAGLQSNLAALQKLKITGQLP